MTIKKISSLFLAPVMLIAGLFLVPIKIFDKEFSKIPGDYGDARFNNYILEHGHKYLTGTIDNYWDAPFMYPYKNVIAFSDNLLGTLPIYSLARIFGADRETSYQLWLLALFALNFICCYWVLMKWSRNNILASSGAYLFAFSIFIIGHIYNVQNSPRFLVPLVFYWAWKYLSQKEIKYFLMLLLGIVYQFYCGIYLGFFLVYVIMFLLIAYLIIYKDKALFLQFGKLKTIFSHLLIILASAILLAPLMIPYIEISHKFGMRSFDAAVSSIPTFRSYFFTSKASVIWTGLSEHGVSKLPDYWCHYLFTGATPWIGLILSPIVLFSKKTNSNEKKFLAFLLLGLFLSFIFCLRIGDFSLYKIIFKLPGFSSMRAINRVINTEIMFFIIIFVFVFKELMNNYKGFKWIVACLPIMIIIDNLINPEEVIRYNKDESQKQIETIKNQIIHQYNKKQSAAIAYIPISMEGSEVSTHLAAMLAAQEVNVSCVNAYTGSHPGEYNTFSEKLNEKGLEQWCEYNKISKDQIQIINDLDRAVISKRKINLKLSTDKYLCEDQALNNSIVANRDIPYLWETFSLIEFENKQYAIVTNKNLFLSVQSNESELVAKLSQPETNEIFRIIEKDNNIVSFLAGNGKYLSLNKKTGKVYAIASSVGSEEEFEMSVEIDE